MRKTPTRSERILWQALRGNALGVKVRRQHVLHPFIVDFYSAAWRLVIEVDGGYHAGRERLDAERDAQLHYWHNVQVMRVVAEWVERDVWGVVACVMHGANTHHPRHSCKC